MSVIASSSIEEKFDNACPKEFVYESCINADIALWPPTLLSDEMMNYMILNKPQNIGYMGCML